jgi:hypothetical protein
MEKAIVRKETSPVLLYVSQRKRKAEGPERRAKPNADSTIVGGI